MSEELEKSQSPYLRPDFQRESLEWKQLDGSWSFAFDDKDEGLHQWMLPEGLPDDKTRKINVPFVYQTPASGIDKQQAHPIVWYQTEIFSITDSSTAKTPRTLLRFGAVDYEATVWLAGQLVGKHRGGHVPFDFDVTELLNDGAPKVLTIRVWDAPTDLTQPRGKQYWGPKPESIFYTPSTGIWQSVWLENVPSSRIADSSHGTTIKANNIETGEIEAEVSVIGRFEKSCQIRITASLAGIEIAESDPAEVNVETGVAKLKLCLRLKDEHLNNIPKDFLDVHPASDETCWHDKLALWSPEHPILYDLTITLFSTNGDILDKVKTYTGMRSIAWNNNDGTFRLNNRPYFQALVLDQGYWPDTNMTPPDSHSCKQDILLSKAMGFDGCRKHQKVESPEFLYWADKLGYLVWGEIANAYEFSTQYVDRFDQEWKEAVRRDINHPCIVAWTPVNETWGYGNLANSETEQNHIRSLYYTTKTLDPTRPVNDNCGWEHVCTDLTTFHDYSDGPQLQNICSSMTSILEPHGGRPMFVGGAQHKHGAPVICTEFGGVNIKPQQGEKEIEGSWGYTTASDAKDLLERVRRLMLGVVEGGHCCGFVYTQLTDIEQETNGLYTFDRKEKLPAAEVKKIIEEAKRIYFERLEEVRK
ncbi:hypothetical protein LTS08_007107 [Lithohypha guttulata]|nr:hypothetical protein LTS08_007107 [Lithohypha guttulata]